VPVSDAAGRHVSGRPTYVTPAIPGPQVNASATSSTEDAMTVDEGNTATAIPVPERYRSAILSSAGFAVAVLLSISEAMVPGRPFGGVEFINVVLGGVVLAVTYWRGNPWVKLASGVAGALLQTLASVWTDDRVTSAEWITIAVTLISALMVGAFPNAPELVTGEPGDDVADVEGDAPPSSTYLPPAQYPGPVD
jgi:hypothetical protein